MSISFCFVQLFHISERGGGAEVQAGLLAKELANRGWKVHYICQTINKSNANTTCLIDDVYVHWIPYLTRFSFYSLLLVYNLLNRIKPDLIIERMSSMYGLPILIHRRKQSNKYIWICTDNSSAERHKFIKSSYAKLPFVKFAATLPKWLIYDWIRTQAIKCSDHAFAQNDIQKALVLKNFGKNTSRMISGHPLPIIQITTEQRFKNKIVLWCGNLGAHKRPELFIKLARCMSTSNYRFIMVGGHADKSYIANLLSNAPLNLSATGHVSFDESNTYFDNATILVNTSVSEGFSNTYIQAWLRGIPTIVLEADPDKVITTRNLGYQAKSLDDATKFISLLLEDFTRYERYSENARDYACEHHTIEKMTDNFLKQIGIENPTLYT